MTTESVTRVINAPAPQDIVYPDGVSASDLPTLFPMIIGELWKANNEANDLSETYARATNGDKERIESILNTDPAFETYRAKLNELAVAKARIAEQEKELQAMGQDKAKAMLPELANVDLDSVKADFLAKKQTVETMLKLFRTGMAKPELLEDVLSLNGFVQFSGLKGARKQKAGSNNRRYRFDQFTVNGTEIETKTLSGAAGQLGVPIDLIRSALIETAGTVELTELAGQEIIFTVTSGDKLYNFNVVPAAAK